jgi:hypothetical protein
MGLNNFIKLNTYSFLQNFFKFLTFLMFLFKIFFLILYFNLLYSIKGRFFKLF